MHSVSLSSEAAGRARQTRSVSSLVRRLTVAPGDDRVLSNVLAHCWCQRAPRRNGIWRRSPTLRGVVEDVEAFCGGKKLDEPGAGAVKCHDFEFRDLCAVSPGEFPS